MTLHAQKSVTEANNIATHYKAATIEPIHLLFAIFLEKGSLGSNILEGLGLKHAAFERILGRRPSKQSSSKKELNPSPELKAAITRAYSVASSFQFPHVGTEHLVFAIFQSEDPATIEILKNNSITENDFDMSVFHTYSDMGGGNEVTKELNLTDVSLKKPPVSTKSPTPFIDQFCVNLNEEAAKSKEEAVGREYAVERIINILGRKNKNNPLLIGEPGVGKTAIVTGLAYSIQSGNAPAFLLDKKIYSLDLALVVAGTTFRGEFENRLKEIIKEASKHPEIILFIDEIHSIVGAGNVQGSLDAANILKPSLSRGQIRCIGATTLSEFRKHIEKDPALARRFQPVIINEPTIDDTIDIIEKVKVNYESFHNLKITPEAIRAAVQLSVRYIPDRFLPDKAFDLIDETASSLRNKSAHKTFIKEIRTQESALKKILSEKDELVRSEQYKKAIALQKQQETITNKIALLRKKQEELTNTITVSITAADIATTVSQVTGIPEAKLVFKKPLTKIAMIEEKLTKKVIGQQEAISKISDALIRSFSGISNPDRPLGSFLFLGPSGVGKTRTAKILAEEVYQDPKALIRIDMSEFGESHNIARLVGAPAGYVGYEEGGKLTQQVRHRPYSIVLFDEIEKAHPDALNILLQILDEGTLTDAQGQKINFRNTIVILTSNIGTDEFTEAAQLGFSENKSEKVIKKQFETIEKTALTALRFTIKPEILNRLDHIIVFNPLSEKDIKKITALELKKLQKRLEPQGIHIRFSPDVSTFIARRSVATENGARLVRRTIQDMVENKIAKHILSGKMKNNSISITIEEDMVVAE